MTGHRGPTGVEASPEHASQIIRDLYVKYGINDPHQAKRLVRERFTQVDFEAYKAALDVLDGSGAIG